MWTRLLAYLGGLVGGMSLMSLPVASTPLDFLALTLDVVGALAVIVFAVALIVYGLRVVIRVLD